jgi:hypothetical protein
MPKRWKVIPASGGNLTYQLLDKRGRRPLYTSEEEWDTEDAVHEELDEIAKGTIEFPDKSEKDQIHHA